MTTAHGYVSRSGKLNFYYRIDRWALRRMDHVIAVSEDLYDSLLQWGIPSNRCSLVENAIDAQQYARTMPLAEAKEQLGLAATRQVIGAVGRLSPEKAFDRLILATDLLLRQGLDVELIVAGDGEEKPRLEALISKLGLGNRIRLLGYRSDLLTVYQAMDVFALSSLREAFPNVILEALASEVPVVATQVAGVPQIIQHEENGLLVVPDDVDQLTGALSRLLRDAALRNCLAAAGRETVEQRYSFANRMRKVCMIYDRVLGRCEATPEVQTAALT